MARDITTINQVNLWGKSANAGLGLDPQRNDLFFVDFSSALAGVVFAAGVSDITAILPQYVRSLVLPELRTKAEPIRRDSVPVNMPSWDDPLDPVKITFLMDAHGQEDRSDVMLFLNTWLALTRAGRGSRFQGYSAPQGYLLLDSDYQVNFQFNINLYLLSGAALAQGGYADASQDASQAQAAVLANETYRNMRAQSGLIQDGGAPPPVPSTPAATAYAPMDEGSPVEQNMVVQAVYILRNAWLGAYKISDLNYKENDLVSVESTFYVDDIQVQKASQISGHAVNL